MTSAEETIYHVTDQPTLDKVADDTYTCDSLEAEGFIHCCTKDQLAGVLERYYQGVTGLKLLKIDTASLTARLIYENTVGGEELFPHVYGPINMNAVVDVSNLE